jgi:hypothetical protein
MILNNHLLFFGGGGQSRVQCISDSMYIGVLDALLFFYIFVQEDFEVFIFYLLNSFL